MSRAGRILVVLVAVMAMVCFGASRVVAAQPEHETAPAAAHDEHAAHEKGELIAPLKQGLPAMIAAFIVFGVVFFVLKSKAWPVIVQRLEEREGKIRSEIESAEMAQRQAKAALEQYEKNLSDARAEAQKMLSDALAQQQVLVAEQRAKAEIELNQMRDRARKDIEVAKKSALSEIYTEAGNLAATMAAKILKREVTPGDQQRLMEESLRELQGNVRNN